MSNKIINPIEKIREAIPEIKNINGKIITITFNNWNNRLKTMETKNMNKYNKSLSWVGIQHYFQLCIIETETTSTGYGVIKIDEDRYKLIRKYIMSDDFNVKGE